MITTHHLKLNTEGDFTVENVTDRLESLVVQSGISDGNVLVFYQHTTGAVMLMEFEAGIMADMEDILDAIAPVDYDYKHHLRGVDFNGHAHIRSAIIGASLIIPIEGGQALLGRYQQVMVIDMQTERKSRSVIIQISGE
jgi:secondary thiamine-phosphate synthase enzyme